VIKRLVIDSIKRFRHVHIDDIRLLPSIQQGANLFKDFEQLSGARLPGYEAMLDFLNEIKQVIVNSA